VRGGQLPSRRLDTSTTRFYLPDLSSSTLHTPPISRVHFPRPVPLTGRGASATTTTCPRMHTRLNPYFRAKGCRGFPAAGSAALETPSPPPPSSPFSSRASGGACGRDPRRSCAPRARTQESASPTPSRPLDRVFRGFERARVRCARVGVGAGPLGRSPERRGHRGGVPSAPPRPFPRVCSPTQLSATRAHILREAPTGPNLLTAPWVTSIPRESERDETPARPSRGLPPPPSPPLWMPALLLKAGHFSGWGADRCEAPMSA
jgi:hypothetical protein